MIKYGFKIKEGQIFDTHISTFRRKAKSTESGVVYVLECIGYLRLYLYEPLLNEYSVDEVFEILKINTFLKKNRLKFESVSSKIHHVSNSTVIYNYPIKYLTPRMFELYKTCQKLKEYIE